ncbi:large conductance mechano sensitive channel protein [Streptococcus pneumoniae]|nr:large conductance mechano sensitive channel protein [Streptococcus pneumoniae]
MVANTGDIAAVSFRLGSAQIGIGAFIAAIINFVIVGAVLFLIVKGMNKAAELAKKDQAEEVAAPAAPTAEDYLKEIRDLLANK